MLKQWRDGVFGCVRFVFRFVINEKCKRQIIFDEALVYFMGLCFDKIIVSPSEEVSLTNLFSLILKEIFKIAWSLKFWTLIISFIIPKYFLKILKKNLIFSNSQNMCKFCKIALYLKFCMKFHTAYLAYKISKNYYIDKHKCIKIDTIFFNKKEGLVHS
ncbi:hypothetical protein BpHYR1_006465 [Brachionus plicatilis]|uniref:Uncharacterized protein n=1 Tax=Brachionus plicatilis TaxID=10195 RepID=A0A3M7R9T3_BRAPC|nr:hypothetical protein BpHYR1_006465 [Brachionus plicatilis]